MAKSFATILILSLFLFSCNKNNNELVIEGVILNLTTPYVIASFQHADTIHVDTILVNQKGEFFYNQNVDTSTVFTFYFNDFSSSTIVFADEEMNKIKVKGDALLPDLIEIKGGEINESLTTFKKENEALLKQRSLLMTKEEYEVDSLVNSENVISEKERIAQINSINHELTQRVEDFILSNPDKVSSVILINDFFKNNENPKSLNRVLAYLKDDALNSPLAYKLRNHNEKLKLSAEGSHMPYFKIYTNKNDTLKSSDFRDKYLLMSFLSSTGEKSKENMRILKDEYNLLDKDDIEFLTIYIDSDSLPIHNHVVDSIPWKVVLEDKSWGSDIIENYNVHYLPFNILINPEGEIISRDIPVIEVKNSIDKSTNESKK